MLDGFGLRMAFYVPAKTSFSKERSILLTVVRILLPFPTLLLTLLLLLPQYL